MSCGPISNPNYYKEIEIHVVQIQEKIRNEFEYKEIE